MKHGLGRDRKNLLGQRYRLLMTCLDMKENWLKLPWKNRRAEYQAHQAQPPNWEYRARHSTLESKPWGSISIASRCV